MRYPNLRLLLLIPGIALVALAGQLVLRPEPASAALRDAEHLWADGRVAEARRAYGQLVSGGGAPAAHVRLAEIELLRGDCAAAQRAAAAALHSTTALRRDEAARAHLVAGQCGALGGDDAYASAEWAAVDPRSPLRAVVGLLRGEAALQAGRRAAAVTELSAALEAGLAEPARSLAHLRIALAVASAEPRLAQSHLAAVPQTLMPAPADLRPFMPLTSERIAAEAEALQAILQGDPAQRNQLLGQRLLDLGLQRLAIERFEAVPETAPEAALARAYAALGRWQLGQRAAALDQLRELSAAVPRDAAVATMYATLLVDADDLDAADAALDGAEAAAPLDPAIALVRSDVLAARHAYPAAMVERRRAFDLARPPQRGRYARALAEQQLGLLYDVCGAGQLAAHTATELEPRVADGWRLLAAVLYSCRDYVGAADAARRGLQLSPARADLEFYLGAALWDSDQRRAAALHLRRAADLEPTGEWRRRAEALLGW